MKQDFKQTYDFKKVAEKHLEKNMDIMKSLRDYDEGKKDISTLELERNLPGIQLIA